MVIRLTGKETTAQRSKVQLGFMVRELHKMLETIKGDSAALNEMRLELKFLLDHVENARYELRRATWLKEMKGGAK